MGMNTFVSSWVPNYTIVGMVVRHGEAFSITEKLSVRDADGTTIYTEDNTTIDVATGDSVTIQLPINPSTGYTWVASYPMGYVQISDDILETESDGAVGVGTHEQWVFSADTAGTATVTFDLFPPGSNAKAEQTVTFTVNAS